MDLDRSPEATKVAFDWLRKVPYKEACAYLNAFFDQYGTAKGKAACLKALAGSMHGSENEILLIVVTTDIALKSTQLGETIEECREKLRLAKILEGGGQ